MCAQVLPYTDPAQIAAIREYYGLDAARLPLERCLVTRSIPEAGPPKRLYFINSGAGQSDHSGARP